MRDCSRGAACKCRCKVRIQLGGDAVKAAAIFQGDTVEAVGVGGPKAGEKGVQGGGNPEEVHEEELGPKE